MAGAVTFHLDGLDKVQEAFRRAGASADDLKVVNARAATLIRDTARERAPERSGRLRKNIVVTSTKSEGKVLGLALVPYMGVIHFGWVTRNALGVRGQTRKQAQARYEGVLAKRTVNKAVAGSKRRVNRKTGATRGAVRGGPIKPNPFMYFAAKEEENAVFQAFDDKAADIVRVFNR